MLRAFQRTGVAVVSDSENGRGSARWPCRDLGSDANPDLRLKRNGEARNFNNCRGEIGFDYLRLQLRIVVGSLRMEAVFRRPVMAGLVLVFGLLFASRSMAWRDGFLVQLS